MGQTPSAAPAESPAPAATGAITATPDPAAALPPLAPPPVATRSDGPNWWPWLGLAVVLLGAAAAFLIRRRSRKQRLDEPEFAPAASLDVSPPAALSKRPQPIRPAAPVPPQAASPEPQRAPASPPPPPPPVAAPPRKDEFLDVTLTARRMSATLMNTALTYELVVTNRGEEPIGPVAVSCDMIGAHASLPARFQLENPGQGDPDHRIPRLGSGESATISGELRLPLAAITPIRQGQAALFVPLARFRLLVWREGRPPVSAYRTFVIGETPATPDAALKPFRLDLGPRMYSSISQREVSVPA